ncbi:hypothetical protein EGW08_023605 [Elysia chlorotica]|uniref:C-type lectin domain-containing protein n=1 Tax=Elysia chlorotica TaxID=188477 RepID=A0A433SIA5_ELYCH|nr:hypothetical protein EGW08_023605 [Elysia chlorotica]
MHLKWFICLMPVTVLAVLELEKRDSNPCVYACSSCLAGWLDVPTNTCITVIGTRKNWSGARGFCRGLGTGADLVKITSARMNWAITYYLPRDDSQFWIGLHLDGTDKRWLDETTNPAYTNLEYWIFDHNHARDCYVTIAPGGKWHREMCSSEKKFICGYPYDPIEISDYYSQ